MHWHSCTRSVGGSPSLEVFHGRGDVALRDVGSGHGGVAGVGLGDLRGHFQPEWFCDSTAARLQTSCCCVLHPHPHQVLGPPGFQPTPRPKVPATFSSLPNVSPASPSLGCPGR